MANAVLVVNGFMRSKRAAEHLLHDYAMFLARTGRATTKANASITVFVDCPYRPTSALDTRQIGTCARTIFLVVVEAVIS